jgi:hypothetical protein
LWLSLSLSTHCEQKLGELVSQLPFLILAGLCNDSILSDLTRRIN